MTTIDHDLDWFNYIQSNIFKNENGESKLPDPKSLNKLLKNFIDKIIEKCQRSNNNGKNRVKSIDYRLKGNEKFQQKSYDECLHLYSQSLLYAPVIMMSNDDNQTNGDNELLALAYNNRSSANYYLDNFKRSLNDIEMALKFGYSKFKSSNRLRERQAKCLIRLNRLKEAQSICNEFGIDCGLISEKINTFDDEQEITENNVDENGCFSLKCCLKHSEQYGRGVYCNNGAVIYPNEIILIEKPYAAVLLSHCERKYCHNCCRKIKMNQFEPCFHCTNVIYCSIDCQNNSFHQYECEILKFLWQFGIGHLALRLMLITDLKSIIECRNIFKNDDSDRNLRIFRQLNRSELPSHYQTLYSLQTHENKFDPYDQIYYRLTSELIVNLLIRMKVYCDINEEETKQILINVCYRHLLQIIINSHTISNRINDDDDDNGGKNSDKIPIATAFYPSLSLINHSCKSNISIEYRNGNECLIKSIKTIRSNEQIFNCYVDPQIPVDQRHKLLQEQYFFECNCEND